MEMNFKVVILGNVGVGKTSILCRGISGAYDEKEPPTLGTKI